MDDLNDLVHVSLVGSVQHSSCTRYNDDRCRFYLEDLHRICRMCGVNDRVIEAGRTLCSCFFVAAAAEVVLCVFGGGVGG